MSDIRGNLRSTLQSLQAVGQSINIPQILQVMASDPHAWLMLAMMVPGLGTFATIIDMGLYLAEGNYQAAALDGLGLLPLVGGGLLKGAKLLETAGREIKAVEAEADAVRLAGAAEGTEHAAASVGREAANFSDKASMTGKAQATFSGPSKVLSKNITRQSRVAQKATEGAHHIVARNSRFAADARAILDRFEIGYNSFENGVFLDKAYHRAIHTKAYYKALNGALSKAASRDEGLFLTSSVSC